MGPKHYPLYGVCYLLRGIFYWLIPNGKWRVTRINTFAVYTVYIVILKMETMTKAHFLIIVLSALLKYSVVYSVYDLQLKPNIGSASCFVHSVNLIQKYWLYLSLEFSCVPFFPLIFGYFLLVSSVCFFS